MDEAAKKSRGLRLGGSKDEQREDENGQKNKEGKEEEEENKDWEEDHGNAKFLVIDEISFAVEEQFFVLEEQGRKTLHGHFTLQTGGFSLEPETKEMEIVD